VEFDEPLGGLHLSKLRKPKFYCGKVIAGSSNVSTASHYWFRNQHPDVISHPECSFEVCKASDFGGSRIYIELLPKRQTIRVG
jgi:quinolinate synthase